LPSDRVVFGSRVSKRERAAGTHWTFRDRRQAAACHKYFEKNSGKRMIDMGLAALSLFNFRLFSESDILPDTSRPCPIAQYQRRWSKLTKHARLGDVVMFRDTSSAMSNVIASWDGNSWSHGAFYVHDGWILDRRTDRESLTRIERYKQPQVRAGLYRCIYPPTPQGERAVLEYASNNFLGSYDYLGAAWAGIKTCLPLRRRPGAWDPYATPNGFIHEGMFWLVCVV